MKHGTGENTIYTCNFCGTSSRSGASMFISRLDKQTAVCQPCVDGFPEVWGTVLTICGGVPDRCSSEGHLAAAA